MHARPMHPRSKRARLLLRLVFFSLLAITAQLFSVKDPARAAQTAGVVSPGLPDNVVYSPVKGGTLFGNQCCPSATKNIQQGAIGDCYFLSSLAAVAIASPGTIQHAIRYNPQDQTYSVTLYRPVGGGDPATAPLVRTVYRINGDIPSFSVLKAPLNGQAWQSALTWLNGVAGALWHPSQLPAATQNSPAYASPVNGVLWPSLMEKAYAAMIPGGYNSLGEGGSGYIGMRAITGSNGKLWVISHQSNGNVLRSVTVKNVPAVADTGGHCILCGLFNGKGLTAVEPNIQVCVRLKTAMPSPGKCTPICKPGHECTERFGASGFDLGMQSVPLEIEVLDIPNPGAHTVIADFVQKDPMQCTSQRPCPSPSQASSGSSSAPPQPVFVSFTTGQANIGAQTLSTVAEMENLLAGVAGRPVTAGTLPPCPSNLRCVDVNHSAFFSPNGNGICADGQPCLDTTHEYYLERYSAAAQTVTLGNPWGSGREVTLSISNFMSNFLTVSTNDVNRTVCSCSGN